MKSAAHLIGAVLWLTCVLILVRACGLVDWSWCWSFCLLWLPVVAPLAALIVFTLLWVIVCLVCAALFFAIVIAAHLGLIS